MLEYSYGQNSGRGSVPTFGRAVWRFTEPLCSLDLRLLQRFRESVFLAQDEAPSNETARRVVRRPLLLESVLQFGEWYVVGGTLL